MPAGLTERSDAIMAQGIKESDWRALRDLHPVALDRFCKRVLDELTNIATDATRSHHQRYLAIHKAVEMRDRELAEAFNDMRRSAAIVRILHMRDLGLLSDEEFGRFSEEMRGTVQQLLR